MRQFIFRCPTQRDETDERIMSRIRKYGVEVDAEFGVIRTGERSRQALLRGHATNESVHRLREECGVEAFQDPRIEISKKSE